MRLYSPQRKDTADFKMLNNWKLIYHPLTLLLVPLNIIFSSEWGAEASGKVSISTLRWDSPSLPCAKGSLASCYPSGHSEELGRLGRHRSVQCQRCLNRCVLENRGLSHDLWGEGFFFRGYVCGHRAGWRLSIVGPLCPGQAWADRLFSFSFAPLERLGVCCEVGRVRAVGWTVLMHSSNSDTLLSFI